MRVLLDSPIARILAACENVKMALQAVENADQALVDHLDYVDALKEDPSDEVLERCEANQKHLELTLNSLADATRRAYMERFGSDS